MLATASGTKRTVVHSENVFLEHRRMSEVLAAQCTVELLHSGVDLTVPREN